MTRTTLLLGRCFCRVVSVTPAAMEITRASVSQAITSAQTFVIMCGLTARMIAVFEFEHTASLVEDVLYPFDAAMSREGFQMSEHEMEAGEGRAFLAMRPSIRADAIIPDPINPTVSSIVIVVGVV
mmetsp:Transcript_2579/g.3970  ORF Transcript_2579/g.3970 Transcript_2579/m.3970 type:complete len:126 (-) Transcript_2579:71-448(-)